MNVGMLGSEARFCPGEAREFNAWMHGLMYCCRLIVQMKTCPLFTRVCSETNGLTNSTNICSSS